MVFSSSFPYSLKFLSCRANLFAAIRRHRPPPALVFPPSRLGHPHTCRSYPVGFGGRGQFSGGGDGEE